MERKSKVKVCRRHGAISIFCFCLYHIYINYTLTLSRSFRYLNRSCLLGPKLTFVFDSEVLTAIIHYMIMLYIHSCLHGSACLTEIIAGVRNEWKLTQVVLSWHWTLLWVIHPMECELIVFEYFLSVKIESTENGLQGEHAVRISQHRCYCLIDNHAAMSSGNTSLMWVHHHLWHLYRWLAWKYHVDINHIIRWFQIIHNTIMLSLLMTITSK